MREPAGWAMTRGSLPPENFFERRFRQPAIASFRRFAHSFRGVFCRQPSRCLTIQRSCLKMRVRKGLPAITTDTVIQETPDAVGLGFVEEPASKGFLVALSAYRREKNLAT
jgi:hypothetical protein